MVISDSLKNHFLIATPLLADDNFQQSVILVANHETEGSHGLIINQPTNVTLVDLFDDLNIENIDINNYDIPIYSGGPVEPNHVFVLHDCHKAYDASIPISSNLSLTTSRDVLIDIAKGIGPHNFIVALGYSGWGRGQLEYELSQNAWVFVNSDPEVLFSIPNTKKYKAATGLLGISIDQLSPSVGHA